MNKITSLLFVASLALAGCQKPADLGRIQQETLATVKVYANQLETMQRRVDTLLARGREVAQAPGVAEAGKRLTQARAALEQLRAKAASAPQDLAAAAKTNDREAVDRVGDNLIADLDGGLALIRADLDAVEHWVAYAEMQPARTAMNQPTGTPEPSPPAPSPAPPGSGPDMGAPGQPNQGNPPAGVTGPSGANAPSAPAPGTQPTAPVGANPNAK